MPVEKSHEEKVAKDQEEQANQEKQMLQRQQADQQADQQHQQHKQSHASASASTSPQLADNKPQQPPRFRQILRSLTKEGDSAKGMEADADANRLDLISQVIKSAAHAQNGAGANNQTHTDNTHTHAHTQTQSKGFRG